MLLAVLCAGGTLALAAGEIGTTVRSVQRYRAEHPEFEDLCEQAKRLFGSNDHKKIDQLLRSVAPDHGSEVAEAMAIAIGEVKVVPREPVIDPDVLPKPAKLVPPTDPGPAGDPEDPNTIVPGLPALTERNLLAFYWRVAHDPGSPAGLRSTCVRALHEHTLMRSHRLRQMETPGEARRAPTARERGLTQETKSSVLRAIIGPPPRKSATPA